MSRPLNYACSSSPACALFPSTLTFPPSLPIQRPGLVARLDTGATAPPSRLQALFLCSHSCVMAAVRGRASALPGSCISGRPIRAQLPPIRLVANVVALTLLIREFYRCTSSIRQKSAFPLTTLRLQTLFKHPPSSVTAQPSEVRYDRFFRHQNHWYRTLRLLR